MMTSTGDPAASFIEATYEQLAQLGDSGLCCSPIELYSPDDLATLPEEILRLSSGCGHPVQDANITPGMTVLDIGSGAGTDAILAARQTGPTGRVIGVDPSAAMRERATRNAAELGLTWIDFRAGTAEALPVDDNTADLVISNCVLSLSTDPTAAWTEIARALRSGGQIVVSDVVGGSATETLHSKTRCETGIEWADYQAMLLRLGFSGIRPLRVRAARFRDGNTAHSITIHAWHGLPMPRIAVDLIHPGSATATTAATAATTAAAAAAAAETLARNVTEAFGDQIILRTLNADDPADSEIVAVLHDGHTPSAPSVAINGRPATIGVENLHGYLQDRLSPTQ